MNLSFHQMYIIGVFLSTNEVEVFPEEWLADTATLVKCRTQCWWPPYKSSGKTAKAVIAREQVDARTWTECSLKVIGRYETFDEARRKLPKATHTSNLDTDDEESKGKRKRQRNKFLVEEEREMSEEDVDEKTKLPMPPKFKKASNKKTDHLATTSTTEKTPRDFIPDCPSPRSFISDCPSPRNITTIPEHHQDLQSRSDFMMLRRDVSDIKCILNKLLQSFEDLKDKIITPSLSPEESEAITYITNKFPLSEEDLQTVENMLEVADTKKNLINYLHKYVGNNIRAATFTLLRMMLSDATGSKYSWVGAKKKKVFSSLRIFEAMSDAIRGRFRDATVQDISIHVKTWLRNAPMRIQMKQKNT